MKNYLAVLMFVLAVPAASQETERPLRRHTIFKTNLLSLVAQRPTISVEKVFYGSLSAEVSFVQGEFNYILFTDHYQYQGVLARIKKHLNEPDFGSINPYAAIYAGLLKRDIQSTGGRIGSTIFYYPSRDFSANSVRGGGSLGISYISKSKIIVDGQMSLGYGTYTKIYKPDINGNSNGYLDAQIWLSVGYCF